MTQVLVPESKYEILGYDEIPVGRIVRNPLNPRPSFHLTEDDPELLSLAEDMKTEGQHRPALVYELLGHYEHPDQPGTFMLLQGERRWTAARIGGMELLRVNLHRTPTTPSQELELLGVEDTHRLGWQPYFEMVHAKRLAESYGVPISQANISLKTSLTLEQLRIAEKLFSLEPEIQEMVARYEEEMHRQKVQGLRKQSGRLAGAGVRTAIKEFTPTKASLVWDIFTMLRQNLALTVKDLSDLQLQLRITEWATSGGANNDDLNNLFQVLKQCGKTPPPGTISKIHNMVKNPSIGVRSVVRTLGNSHVQRLCSTTARIEKLGSDAAKLTKHVDHFGHDIELLEAQRIKIVSALREMDRFERVLSDRIRNLGRTT